jgi:hypothetical protein
MATPSPLDHAHNGSSIQRGRSMAMNMFEGARRIAKLIAALWVIGWLVAAFQVRPDISVTYKVTWPDVPPVRMSEDCPSDSGTKYERKATQNGTSARVIFCFLAYTSSKGDRSIPYEVDRVRNLWRGSDEYSTEVRAYMSSISNNFRYSADDENWIEGQKWPSIFQQLGLGALGGSGGLVFLWAFTWATGWIVRGFMGIPRGSDSRE